jgi:succinoglycan biosynthesis transport protein ExoP
MNGTPQNESLSAARQATARDFLTVVFRRKWLILSVVAISLTTPLVYVSAGRLLVKRGEQESVLEPYRRVFSEWEQDLASEIEVVKGNPVLQRAQEMLRQRAATGGPRIRLAQAQVDVEVMGKSNVVAIAYQDANPEVARIACDALIQAYIEYRQRSSAMPNPKQFFEQELGQVERDLGRWTELRREYANREGIADLEEEQRSLIGQLGMLNQRLSDVSAELAVARTEQQMMQQLRGRPDIDLPTLGERYSNESALVDIKRRLVEQEARVAELRERYREDSPEVTNALSTLATLRQMLKREVEARLEISASRTQVLESKLGAIRRDRDSLQRRLDTMPDKAKAVQEMDRQIAVLKVRYQDLMGKSDQAMVTEKTSPLVSVMLLSPAGAAVPKNTRDYVRLALAPAFSLVVGIGLAFFIDGLDLTVRTASQAEDAIELPVLASLADKRGGG